MFRNYLLSIYASDLNDVSLDAVWYAAAAIINITYPL